MFIIPTLAIAPVSPSMFTFRCISRRGASAIVGYEDFLSELKNRISKAQLQVVVAVNKELILLYWQIGRDILNRQQQQG